LGNQQKDNAEKDAGAFQALFMAFFPKVQAMLMRQGADKETAEEIAQETMLAVWRKRHQFSADRGKVFTWICAIARNPRIDRIRRQIVWQRTYTEWETIERLQD
jgi:RNA polymerase sigma-70 factor (ECF subfamily)